MSELVEIAILAYRNGRYRDAIELLLQVIDNEKDNWLARLYLGMCYEKSGRVSDAHRLFKRIAAECPDDHVRTKAENALPLVEAEMRRKFQQKDTQPKKKPDTDDGSDLIWFGNGN